MARIFGISSLPVETIGDVIQPGRIITPIPKATYRNNLNNLGDLAKFSKPKVKKNTSHNTSNYKNGFGKLISLFQKSK